MRTLTIGGMRSPLFADSELVDYALQLSLSSSGMVRLGLYVDDEASDGEWVWHSMVPVDELRRFLDKSRPWP